MYQTVKTAKNSMDCYAWGFSAEECYSCMEVGDGAYRDLFCTVMYNCSNCLYCYHCVTGTRNCFGCAGLRGHQYCIFNKQYSQEEYERVVAKIIEHMQSTSEWGQFFPYELCHLPYNQSIAQDYLPLTKEEVLKLGALWDDTEELSPQKSPSIPDSIEDSDETICEKVFSCSETAKPHRILKQEYAFLKEHNIPIPTRCWFARHMARLKKRNSKMLWDRKCDTCGKDIRTSYAPNRPEIVFCDECYLKEVY
jgi:hypothetical protein